MEGIIFDFTRKDWQYKGILFAELDQKQIEDEYPNGYVVGVMALMNKANGILKHA